jgi:hypothetical protein
MSMTRFRWHLAGALTLVALASGPAHATPTELPTIDVHVADRAVTLEGEDDVGRGPIRLAFERDGDGDGEPRTLGIVELEPGHTAEEIGSLGALVEASPEERMGRLVAAVSVPSGAATAVSFETRARRYVVIDATNEDQPRAEFEPDVQHSGATLPAADATIELRDRSAGASHSLPRNGIIRIRNAGRQPRHLFAVRLPADKTLRQGLAELRRGARDLGRVGEPTDLASLLPADAAVRVERRLKPGRYVLASFHAGTGPGATPLLATARVR